MKTNGFTLIELLATLSILSIISFIGIPSLADTLHRNDIESSSQVLLRSFQQARTMAVTNNNTIMLCGSNDGVSCSKDWSEFILVFEDSNDDKIAAEEEIITQQSLSLSHGIVKTRVSLGLSYIKINPDGSAKYLGSMIFCPNNEKAQLIRRVTWNRVGRPYYGRDTDGNGVVENTKGENMECQMAA